MPHPGVTRRAKAYRANLLWWAKAYCDLGWKLVPLHSVDRKGRCTCHRGAECIAPGKHPRVRGWKDIATNDLNKVRRWIDKFGDVLNIGVACGPESGITVLDVDGNAGIKSIAALEAEHGLLPDTLRAITGSGGAHLVFRSVSTEIRNRVKVLDGLDVRHGGSYIVVTPSRHRSGNVYEWATDFATPVAPMPDWLVQVIESSKSGAMVTEGFSFGDWLAKQDPSIEGQNGSSQCMRVAAKAVRVAKIRSFDVFLREIGQWNAKCEPPWSEEELRHKFDDALNSWEIAGRVDLPMTDKGAHIPNLETYVKVLRGDSAFAGQLAYDKATQTVVWREVVLLDHDLTRMRLTVLENYPGLKVAKDEFQDAVLMVARENAYNSVELYLRGLEWDGRHRLDKVHTSILRCKAVPLYREYMRRWFIACVARAIEPGCKQDTALVFRGKQGGGKSTFFEELAAPWHCDSMLDLKSKDGMLNLARTWVYEWSEIETIYSPKDVSRVKNFLSSRNDLYRAPYARIAESNPRHTVFVGTTNKDVILYDETGSRRFWVMDVSDKIHVKLLRKWKDQLWAEAFARWEIGERWHLPKGLERKSERMNEAYLPENPIGERAVKVGMVLSKEKGWFTLQELGSRIGMDFTRRDMSVQAHITDALRKGGFERQLKTKRRLAHWIHNKDMTKWIGTNVKSSD